MSSYPCDDIRESTLALIGSTPTGWIIFGYALLVSRLALIALRFARRRDEQA